MDADVYRRRRNENRVAPEEAEKLFAVRVLPVRMKKQRAAAVYAYKHLKRSLIRMIRGKISDALGIDAHAFDREIPASSKELRSIPRFITEHAHRLSRRTAAMQVRNIERLVDMQLPLLSVFINPVIVE